MINFLFQQSLLDVIYGVGFLLIIYTLVRFVSTSLSDLLKTGPEKPIVVDPHINGVHYGVSYWTEKGGRPYQEDRHEQIKGRGREDSSLYGVFDGHGGDKAAQYCKDHLLQHILTEEEFTENPAAALEKAFFRTDNEFSKTAKARSWNDGSTAIAAVIHESKLYVANAGDSRAILVQRGGQVKPMSNDHKPNRKDEEQRIVSLGGKIVHWGRWRVQGVLAVSRAIGDVSLQPYVTCEPEIERRELTHDDEYLVLATDGIWDVLSNEQVGKLIRNTAARGFLECAKVLCSEALIMGSTDNVTVLVVDLRNRHQQVQAKGYATDAKSRGSVQGGYR